MTTNREQFEKVFGAQLATAHVNDGIYAPGMSDGECVKQLAHYNNLTEDEALEILLKKKQEWADKKGERLFYYFMKVVGAEDKVGLEVLRAWENDLIAMFDTHAFSLGESDLPYAEPK
jgi:hypothetical protein